MGLPSHAEPGRKAEHSATQHRDVCDEGWGANIGLLASSAVSSAGWAVLALLGAISSRRTLLSFMMALMFVALTFGSN